MLQGHPADSCGRAARAAEGELPESADRRFRCVRPPPVAAICRRDRSAAAPQVPCRCPSVLEPRQWLRPPVSCLLSGGTPRSASAYRTPGFGWLACRSISSGGRHCLVRDTPRRRRLASSRWPSSRSGTSRHPTWPLPDGRRLQTVPEVIGVVAIVLFERATSISDCNCALHKTWQAPSSSAANRGEAVGPNLRR